jgi:hypothetical protein
VEGKKKKILIRTAGIIPRLPTTPNFFLDAVLFVNVVAKYFSFNTFSEDFSEVIHFVPLLEQDNSKLPAVWKVMTSTIYRLSTNRHSTAEMHLLYHRPTFATTLIRRNSGFISDR